MDSISVLKGFMPQYTTEARGAGTGLVIWRNSDCEEVLKVRFTELPTKIMVIYSIDLYAPAKGKKITSKLIRYLKESGVNFRMEDVTNKGLYEVCVNNGLFLVKESIGTYLTLGESNGVYGTFEYKAGDL